MQTLGKGFVVKRVCTDMRQGSSKNVCELVDGSWIMGMERTSPFITSVEEVSEFSIEIKQAVSRWLERVNAEGKMPAKPRPQVVGDPGLEEWMRLGKSMSEELRRQLISTFQQSILAERDSILAGHNPLVSSHIDGYVEEEGGVNVPQPSHVQGSGGILSKDVHPETGTKVWHPTEEQVEIRPSGIEQFPAAPQPTEGEREVAELRR